MKLLSMCVRYGYNGLYKIGFAHFPYAVYWTMHNYYSFSLVGNQDSNNRLSSESPGLK